jgi:hypothetical protein
MRQACGAPRAELYSAVGNDRPPSPKRAGPKKRGAIAQLGERFNGIEEVVGSIPSGSTK